MGGKLRASRRRDSGSGQALLISVVAVFGLALALAAGPAVAKKITGSKRSERIVGTKKSDRINGKGGNDLIKGKGGKDKLRGGKGGDVVAGGKGVDRHLGGPGNDVLKAADGRRDSVIDGGSGANRCTVDVVELSIVRNCGTVQASTPGGGQGPGGGGGGGGGGPGPAQGLRVLTLDVTCSPAPDLLGCSFHITGNGADEVTVASPVEGGGGVTNVAGVANALSLPNWEALGGYTCTAAGFLRITVGSESVDVTVPCTPGPPPGGGGGGGGSLQATSVDVTCSPAPDVLGCSFHISGDGADAAGPGSVEGGGGVTNVVGGGGSLSPPNWDALGGYTCTAAGFLTVTIGSESVDVPVACAPG